MPEPQVPGLAVSSRLEELEQIPSQARPARPLPNSRKPLRAKDSVYPIFIGQLRNKGNRRVFFFLNCPERPHENPRGQRPPTCSLPPSSPTSLPPWILPEHATGSLGFATWPCPNPFLTSSLPMSHDDMKNWASGDLPQAIWPLSVPGDPGH